MRPLGGRPGYRSKITRHFGLLAQGWGDVAPDVRPLEATAGRADACRPGPVRPDARYEFGTPLLLAASAPGPTRRLPEPSGLAPLRLGPQTSGRSIGGLSSVAPPARNSWAGRPPCRVVVPPAGTRKPGVPVTLRWKLRGSRATPHTASYT